MSVEFAMIRAWLDDGVPFDQWRAFPIGDVECQILRRLRLYKEYYEGRARLGAVLYQARIPVYFSLRRPEPFFKVRRRTDSTMRKDAVDRQVVDESILGWKAQHAGKQRRTLPRHRAKRA